MSSEGRMMPAGFFAADGRDAAPFLWCSCYNSSPIRRKEIVYFWRSYISSDRRPTGLLLPLLSFKVMAHGGAQVIPNGASVRFARGRPAPFGLSRAPPSRCLAGY